MENIRDLYKDRDNSKTIPDCIYRELRKHSNLRSSVSVRGTNGNFKTTYGEMLLPIFPHYTYNDLNFYLTPKDCEILNHTLQNRKIVDKDYNIIGKTEFHKYLKSYSDGFNKGYNECESLFQKNNSLFKETDENKAYNIFSRVLNYNKKGGFPFGIYLGISKDDDIKLDEFFKKHYPVDTPRHYKFMPQHIDESECLVSGYNGGVFYKCWLIILDNPLLFESFFIENEKKTNLDNPLPKKLDELQKNPHITIFKNDFAFALFEKMKEIYSKTTTQQADYSFLFDIMQKDGFAICTGIKFIEFLSNFDISITKIDSSKTGNKRKTTIYNSIKENLLEKHGLSTV